MIEARAAGPDDVAIWRELRRGGIEKYPSAFIISLEEHDAAPVQADADRLANGDRFLAFDAGRAVGLIGVNRNPEPRGRHRAEIGPFYVTPSAQGSGVANALIKAALEYAAAKGMWQIELWVNEDNPRALAFYLKHGFSQIGRLPNAFIGAGGPETDLLMLRELPHV